MNTSRVLYFTFLYVWKKTHSIIILISLNMEISKYYYFGVMGDAWKFSQNTEKKTYVIIIIIKTLVNQYTNTYEINVIR